MIGLRACVAGEVETADRAPAGDAAPPVGGVGLGVLARLPDADHVLHRMAGVGDDGEVDADVLVHARPVDIDMDLAAVRTERIQAAGDAVVEAAADCDHQIGLVHRHVRLIRPVHAEHAEELLRRGGEGAKAHQCRGDRRARDAGELDEQLRRRRTRIDDAATGVEDRALGGSKHVDDLLDLRLRRLDARAIRLVLDRAGLGVARGRDLNVLGDIDDDGAGTAAGCDMERLVDRRAQLRRVLYQVIVLGAVTRDADRVGFLERVCADQPGRNLAGDDDHRDRIEQSIGDAGDRIGRAGAGGDEDDTGLAGRAGIALRRMRRRLFVADEDVLDPRAVGVRPEHRVIDRQDRPAGVAEHDLHAEIAQRLDQDVCSALFAHGSSPPELRLVRRG